MIRLSHARTYRQALKGAFSLLEEADENRQLAEWLLSHLCQCSKTEWLEKLDEPIPREQVASLMSWLERILAGEPYQYVIGVHDFYGREFQVSPAVLIPRPETELLVEQVLHKLKEIWPERRGLTGVDVGTGSGVIAITLDLEANQQVESRQANEPFLHMFAVDISADALQVAQANAARLASSVTFFQSDLLQTLLAREVKLDLIISNPPYIPYADREQLADNVVHYEPHIALFAEENGLYFYRQIIEQAPSLLQFPSLLAFEVGFGQAEAVISLIKQRFPQANCELKKDLRGIERIVLATIYQSE